MWIRTDDPERDFAAYDAEEAEFFARYPKCSECGETITDDKCFSFDGKLICSKCLEENHEVWTEDYVQN